MKKEKEFPPEVLKVLRELQESKDKDGTNDQLSVMQKLTENNDTYKNMWAHILRQKGRAHYAEMSRKETVYCFLNAAIDSLKEEIPVFYFNEKSKGAEKKKILSAQEKLKKTYKRLFAEESTPFIEALESINVEVIKKIDDSYLRAHGDPRIRKIHTFIREMAQKNLWICEEQLHSVLRTAVLALYSFKIPHDANIVKILK